MNAPVVELNEGDICVAAIVGIRRVEAVISLGRRNTDGEKDDGRWERHIEGAAAELAFAKWKDKFWSGMLGRTDQPDVGKVEVRWTRRDDGCLIVKERDSTNAPYVLVVGQIPRFEIRGWIWGKCAKVEEFWVTKTGRPAYFVPQSRLQPVIAA